MFLAELGAIARRRSLDPERLTAIYDSSSTLLDRLLIRLVSSYPVGAPSTGSTTTGLPDAAQIRRPV